MGRHKKIPDRLYEFVDYDDYREEEGGRRSYRAACPKCGRDRGYKRPHKLNMVCKACAVEHMRSFLTASSRDKQSCAMRGRSPWNKGRVMPQHVRAAMVAGHDRAKGTTRDERLLRQRVHKRFHALVLRKLKFRLLSKTGNVFKHLPYTVDELIAHLESQFEDGMTWANHGVWDRNSPTWHIDHVKPDCLFQYSSMEDDGFKQSWALSNLRPLWATLNLKKGSRYRG